MEPISAISTVGGLIGGIVQLVSTITNLKERWDYAELNITTLFSTLWAVKAALEEIAEWRSTSKDKNPNSEKLDTNLELCIQGTAVLVAYMENRLKDMHLEDISKYDKVKFMNLDTLFRNLSNDLGAQVRALQLLLTTYQCRTLSEQNERLQRKDTRRVIRAARESTSGWKYVEKDIEDAASILSEAPTTNFEFDRILMQHQHYSRTYPRLYERMQQNFPTRRSSTISNGESANIQRNSRVVENPFMGQNTNLPFLGVPFKGEAAVTAVSKPDIGPSPGSDIPVDLGQPKTYQEPEEPETSQNLAESVGEEIKPNRFLNLQDLDKNITTNTKSEIDAMPSISPEQVSSRINNAHNVQPGTKALGRKTSFHSLYDDSDEEPIENASKSRIQSPAVVEDLQDGSTDVNKTVAQSNRGSMVSSKDEEQNSVSVDAPSLRPTSSQTAKDDARIQQESLRTSDDTEVSLLSGTRSLPGPAKILPIIHGNNDHVTSGKDVSVHMEEGVSGDRHQLDFMSGLLKFSFDHDIDLQITPQTSSFKNGRTIDLPVTATPSIEDSKSVSNLQVSQQDLHDATDRTDSEISTTKDVDVSSVAAGDSGLDQSTHIDTEQDLSKGIMADTQSNESAEPHTIGASPFKFVSSPKQQDFDDEDLPGDVHHYTHRNDPFRSPSHEEIKEVVQDLAPPERAPPLPPRNLETPEDPVLESQQPSNDLCVPASHARAHSLPGSASIISVESLTTSKNSTSDETAATTVTAATSNSMGVIPDPVQHEKMRSTISKSLTQLSHHAQPSTRNRFSTFASKLNRKATSERNAKAQQLAQVMMAGNTARVVFVIGTFDKAADVSTPAAINNEKEPITALLRAARLDNAEFLGVLLQSDPQGVISVDATGRTILHHAITANASRAVLWLADYLRDRGVTATQGKGNVRAIDMKDKNGISAVHLAARLDDIYLFETLQKAGADCAAKDNDGRSVLEYAVEARNFHMVHYLLKQNLVSDINSRNIKGETALMVAARVDDGSSLGFLLNAGASKGLRDGTNGNMAVHYAARYGNLDALELLFQSIEDVVAKNTIGEQPLHLAAVGNHVHVLSALLHIPGIDPNVWTEPPHLRQAVKREEGLAATAKLASTALHYACSAGHHQAADILLERGARVNSNQEDGYSALMMACQAQSSAIVSLLLLHDADPKASTSAEGMTALHIACKVNDVASTKMLLQHGASPMARLTSKGKETPDALARRDGQPHQQSAGDICADYRRAVLRDQWGLTNPGLASRTMTTTAANTTYPPNVRPMISPYGFPMVPATNQSVGMAYGEPIAPLPPPPPYSN